MDSTDTYVDVVFLLSWWVTVFRAWVTPKVLFLGGCQISINCQTNDRGLFVMILTAFLWVYHLDHSRTYEAIKFLVYTIHANTLSCTLCTRSALDSLNRIDKWRRARSKINHLKRGTRGQSITIALTSTNCCFIPDTFLFCPRPP